MHIADDTCRALPFRLRLDAVLTRSTTLALLPLIVGALALTTAKLARGGLPQNLIFAGVMIGLALAGYGLARGDDRISRRDEVGARSPVGATDAGGGATASPNRPERSW